MPLSPALIVPRLRMLPVKVATGALLALGRKPRPMPLRLAEIVPLLTRIPVKCETAPTAIAANPPNRVPALLMPPENVVVSCTSMAVPPLPTILL